MERPPGRKQRAPTLVVSWRGSTAPPRACLGPGGGLGLGLAFGLASAARAAGHFAGRLRQRRGDRSGDSLRQRGHRGEGRERVCECVQVQGCQRGTLPTRVRTLACAWAMASQVWVAGSARQSLKLWATALATASDGVPELRHGRSQAGVG